LPPLTATPVPLTFPLVRWLSQRSGRLHKYGKHIPELIDNRARNGFSGLLAKPLVFAIGTLADTDTSWLLRLWIEQHHIGNVQGGLYFNATRLSGPTAPKVFDDDIHALDYHAILLIDHLADFASLTAIASTNDDNFVAGSDLAHLVAPFALKHFWRKRDDPHELSLTKLAPDGTKNAGPARIALLIDKHGSIVIKFDMASIRTAIFLRCADDYRPNHVAFFDAGIGLRRFDRGDDDIADAAPSPGRTAQYADAHDFACTAVVCDAQSRLWLNHGVTSPINCNRLLKLGSTLYNLTDNPPLIFGERSGLLNPDKIAFIARIAVVVRKERTGSGDSLVIKAVTADKIH
jgi:hypothetical protein